MFNIIFDDTRDIVFKRYIKTNDDNTYDYFNSFITSGDNVVIDAAITDMHTVESDGTNYWLFGDGDNALNTKWAYSAPVGTGPVTWTVLSGLPNKSAGDETWSMAYDSTNDIRIFVTKNWKHHVNDTGVWSTYDGPEKPYDIEFGNGKFMTAHATGARTSTDGVVWTDRTSTQEIYKVWWTGTRWVAMDLGATPAMYYSNDDGDTWTACTMIGGSFSTSIAITSSFRAHFKDIGGTFYAMSGNQYRSSTDGITWTLVASGGPTDYGDIGEDGQDLVVVPVFESIAVGP